MEIVVLFAKKDERYTIRENIVTVWQIVLPDLSVPEISQKYAAHCAGSVSEKFVENCVSEEL